MDAFLRIFSDIHYGDRSSRVHALPQLAPLFNGPSAVLLNGDTLDTRAGPDPALTAELRHEVTAFFTAQQTDVTFLTGNHDADFSSRHLAELAGGAVVVTHGDILYPDIVPWSQDAPRFQQRLAEEFSKIPRGQHTDLETRFTIFRRVAASIPQRHQSEQNFLKYAVAFARDTVWPPARLISILSSWQQLPRLAEEFVRAYRPQAKFILVGHTHRPGIWRRAGGLVVINTGSFSLPFGALAVDLTSDRLIVRRIAARRGEFHPGRVVAEFSLATA